MTSNVFVFGAGTSFDAGIPLMGNFIDVMQDIYFRPPYRENSPYNSNDREILEKAFKLREELLGHHACAAFDDRNIEDILSILSFENKRKSRKKSDAFIEAINRTIDIKCHVTAENYHDGYFRNVSSPEVYEKFWGMLTDCCTKRAGLEITIISFNYDLVLERSLIAFLTKQSKLKRSASLGCDYELHYHLNDDAVVNLQINDTSPFGSHTDFRTISESRSHTARYLLKINLLKPHGSLNFPSETKASQKLSIKNFCDTVPNPIIVPPVFDKLNHKSTEKIWSAAFDLLEDVEHISFVGYSLPKTDVYFQYFLKAAIGRANSLRKISVFNPCLSKADIACTDMKERYLSVFSPQLHNRIEFSDRLQIPGAIRVGTFEEFCDNLGHSSFLI